jgi:membrane-associated phospholipid phosphatase
MKGMHYLKEDSRKNAIKILYLVVASAVTFPVCFFYLDKKVILWIRNLQKDNSVMYWLLGSVDPIIGFISHGTTLIIIAVILYIFGRYVNKRLYEVGRSLSIGFISSGITAQILKHLIGRARPRLTDNFVFIGPSIKSGYDSFPSGHTTVIFCLAYIISRYFPRYKVIFYSLALIAGLDRVEDVSHFPSDVLSGAIIGLFIGKMLSVKMSLPSEHRNAENNNVQEVRQGPYLQ